MNASLYICYFGLREPLVQTQVLPYLHELAKGGWQMSLLTFEPRNWSDADAAEWRERLHAEGIAWHRLPYHKRVPGKLLDLIRGAFRAASIARDEKIGIFHGRSHVGAAIGALAKLMRGGKLVFDFRGFLAEEYVDSGNWRAGGALFRLTKAAERWLLRRADGVVVLTENARALLPGATVIPCCVDVGRFAAAPRAALGLDGRVVYAYAGSLGGYYLVRETAELLEAARARDPRTFALILTHSPAEGLTRELEARGFSRHDYRVVTAAPRDVPSYLAAADVGLAAIEPSFARRAMSPTKFAEYLAAGLPVIASAGIGDVDRHIEEARAGALLRRHDRAAYAEALATIEELRRDPALAERCRAEARARYDLTSVGGARYRRVYESLDKLRVLALASYPVEAAASRFRVVQFIAPLAERGIDVDFSPFLDAPLFAALYKPRRMLASLPWLAARTLQRIGTLFARADAVLVQREAMLFGPAAVEWFLTRVRRMPMILDLDDATWIAYSSPVYGRLAPLLKAPRKTDRLIRWAHVVTCGSPNIAAYAAARGAEAMLVPTVADTRVYFPKERQAESLPLHVGWIGTHGTYPFLERLLPLLERLRAELRFELTIIGSGQAIDTRPWQMEREPDDFRSLDVGVYPIGSDAWSVAKSGFKAVQYLASGVPFVMSPVGVCATMGVPGETHLLATTDEEWLDALRRLITDADLRARMGRAGRAFAERHYSVDVQADALAAAIRKAAR